MKLTSPIDLLNKAKQKTLLSNLIDVIESKFENEIEIEPHQKTIEMEIEVTEEISAHTLLQLQRLYTSQGWSGMSPFQEGNSLTLTFYL